MLSLKKKENFMTDEELLKKTVENPDFLCESGSHLYGMATEDSDYDLRGFTLPPFKYLIGVKKFESIELEGDVKIYSAQYFLKLVLRGDPQSTELMFASQKNIKRKSSAAQTLLEERDNIVSNVIFNRVMGYSNSEWRKAMAIRIIPKHWKKEKEEVINDIRNLWKPPKEVIDSIIKNLRDLEETEIVESKSGLGTKRKSDVEKYGFCRKSAAHSIRLVREITELMTTGEIRFPVADCDTLLQIRNGQYSKEAVEEIYKEAVSEAESARTHSVLRDKPDSNKVWEVYTELVANHISNNTEFINIR